MIVLDLVYFLLFLLGLMKLAELAIAGFIHITVALDRRAARSRTNGDR